MYILKLFDEELLKFEVNEEQYDAFEKGKRAYVAWWPDSKRYEVIMKSFEEWCEEKAMEKKTTDNDSADR